MRPLLVGEINHRTTDSRFDLYPLPEHGSGGRLCKLLGITPSEYLRTFDRMNLCHVRWDRETAGIMAGLVDVAHRQVILLGRKVASFFGMSRAKMFSKRTYGTGRQAGAVYVIPHPSGKNRMWNDAENVKKVRKLLSKVLEKKKVTA